MSHIDATIVAPTGAETEAPPAAPPVVQTVIEGAPGAPPTSAAPPAKVYNAKAGADVIDYMRVRRDSAVGRLNAALSFTVAKTVKQLAEESSCATASAHLSWALKRAFVVRVAPSTYLRAPHTREGAVVDAMAALTGAPPVVNGAPLMAPPADSNGAAVAPPVVETDTAPPVKETKKQREARLRAEKAAAKAPPVEAPTDETALVETQVA